MNINKRTVPSEFPHMAKPIPLDAILITDVAVAFHSMSRAGITDPIFVAHLKANGMALDMSGERLVPISTGRDLLTVPLLRGDEHVADTIMCAIPREHWSPIETVHSKTAWTGLSSLAVRAVERANGASLPENPRAAASVLMGKAFEFEMISRGPEVLVNITALALSARECLVVQQISSKFAALLNSKPTRRLPPEPPRLFESSWILETSDPARGGRLFGDTVALGGYELDGVNYLIGFQHPRGARVARWKPQWGGNPEEGCTVDNPALLDDARAHSRWTLEAARFAVKVGVAMDILRLGPWWT